MDNFCFKTDATNLCIPEKINFLSVTSSSNMGDYRTGGFVGLAPIGEDTTELVPIMQTLYTLN